MKVIGTPATPSVPDARAERQRALLRTQPWGLLLKQLTAIALKRINGRSLSDAEDLAQSAIADAYQTIDGGGWDPDRGALRSYLVARVITTAGAERRRKRNTCEVWLDEEAEEEGEEQGPSAHEKYLADDKPAPDAALYRLRFASTFHDRLLARLADDAEALEIIPLMTDEHSTPVALAKETGKLPDEVTVILRRVRYHAHEITKELSAQIVTPLRGGSRSNEVTQ